MPSESIRGDAAPALAGAPHAQSPDAQAQHAENPFEALAWLAGGRWIAETPNARRHNPLRGGYAWTPHRRLMHIRLTRTVADGQRHPGSEGVCWWDPATRSLQLLEVDPAGRVTRGTVDVSGERVVIREVMSLADGSTLNVRTEIERVGADSFTFVASAEQNGESRRVLRWVFERRVGGG